MQIVSQPDIVITDTDRKILALWRRGLDTVDIAQRLDVHQSVVANRLPRIREIVK